MIEILQKKFLEMSQIIPLNLLLKIMLNKISHFFICFSLFNINSSFSSFQFSSFVLDPNIQKYKIDKKIKNFSTSFMLSSSNSSKGEILFLENCIACHQGGQNIIIPEKNLKKETLEANGMNTSKAIIYQITNGKNGMPAFGRRLKENDIQKIADYVLKESESSFYKR